MDPLDESLQRQFCSVLQVGCDRQTACHFLGITARQLHEALQTNAEFQAKVLCAEASPEFNHMHNVFNASKDEKNWRASVWWLERNSPERYARSSPAALTTKQLQQAIDELADVLVQAVADPRDQQRLLDELGIFARQLEGESFEPAPVARSRPS